MVYVGTITLKFNEILACLVAVVALIVDVVFA
jgi:hypothetical protein